MMLMHLPSHSLRFMLMMYVVVTVQLLVNWMKMLYFTLEAGD